MPNTPRVFISYSHDDQTHKEWVLKLSDRLVRNGVDVLLDQWDLRLGGDLPLFMEKGLTDSVRVLAVCSEKYVEKANGGNGGVGYEKMILTGQLMQDVTSDKIIPIIRNNDGNVVVPTFLSSRRYIDFRADDAYEALYAELLHDIHGQPIASRPELGANPFSRISRAVDPSISFSSERYVSPALSGVVTFDCSNNDGRFVVGAGDMAFETKWSGPSSNSIIAYCDHPSISAVALVTGVAEIAGIADASHFDTSSRTRRPRLGEIVVWQNTAGYYLATKIENVQGRGHGASADELKFSYTILPNKGFDFRDLSARS